MAMREHGFLERPIKSVYWDCCAHCGLKYWQHPGKENDPVIITMVERYGVRPTKGEYDKKGYFIPGANDTPEEELPWQPYNYEEIIQNVIKPVYARRAAVFSQSDKDILKMGFERFEEGAKDYQRFTKYGKINACWLPMTNTAQDVLEELIDALFNVCVFQTKTKMDLAPTIYELMSMCKEWKKASDEFSSNTADQVSH